jgi:L-fuconolactonase
MVIDTHQHFWRYDPQRDSWITEDMRVLKTDFLPKDLKPELENAGIQKCIAVQADQSLVETEFLLSLARDHSFVCGVVGWVDLRSDNLSEVLASLKPNSRLKGFRHILQGEPELLEDKSFIKGVSTLSNFNFTYDLLVYYTQLDSAVKFTEAVSDSTRIVLDHIAKPSIRTGEFDQWARGLTSLSSNENVYCKISGMITEANWQTWSDDDIIPYMDFVLETFGPSRLMYGSDWPVCLLAGSYQRQWNLVKNYVDKLSKHEQEQIWSGNATRFYNL